MMANDWILGFYSDKGDQGGWNYVNDVATLLVNGQVDYPIPTPLINIVSRKPEYSVAHYH
jgi:hypothetical protein